MRRVEHETSWKHVHWIQKIKIPAWEEGRKNQPLFIPPPPYSRLPLYFVAHSHHPLQLNDYSADWCFGMNIRRRGRRRIENGCCSIQCSTTRYYYSPGLSFLSEFRCWRLFLDFLCTKAKWLFTETIWRHKTCKKEVCSDLGNYEELLRTYEEVNARIQVTACRQQDTTLFSHSIANVLVTFTTHTQLNLIREPKGVHLHKLKCADFANNDHILHTRLISIAGERSRRLFEPRG